MTNTVLVPSAPLHESQERPTGEAPRAGRVPAGADLPIKQLLRWQDDGGALAPER